MTYVSAGSFEEYSNREHRTVAFLENIPADVNLVVGADLQDALKEDHLMKKA